MLLTSGFGFVSWPDAGFLTECCILSVFLVFSREVLEEYLNPVKLRG
jgi:hypothetical protein